MPGEVDSLVLQLLEWLDRAPRTYTQVMDAWRSTCPRLSIWEDAQAEGLVRVDERTIVQLTDRGREMLEKSRLRIG